MSDVLALAIIGGVLLAWGVYRWFRPTKRQREMIALYERMMRGRGNDD